MKDADIGKGVQSYKKDEVASATPPELPDLQDAASQPETTISVEAASTGGGGDGIMVGLEVLDEPPDDLYQGRIWMER
jgi:hypothetical protein